MPMRIGIAAGALAVMLSTSGCGGSQAGNAIGQAAPLAVDDAWPAHAPSPGGAATVEEALGSADGAEVRVRAYLVAITLPCPACNVGTQRPPREVITGRTARPVGPAPPGCLPCPEPAATISDAPPGASSHAGGARPSLRAVGAATGLQRRHVGRGFLFVGVLHTTGANGPELEVTEVRALD